MTDVKWKIENTESLMLKNFTISPNEGELKIKEVTKLNIMFEAKEEKKIEDKIIFIVSSFQNELIKSQKEY